MSSSPRIHRPTAIIAAMLMSLTQMSDIFASRASISADTTGFFLMELIVNTLVTVLLVTVLLRGRRDTAAGVLFLVTVFAPLLSAYYQLLSVLLGFEMILYALLCGISGFMMAVFRGVLAGECLSRGGVSAGAGRIFLWILPVVIFLCEAVAHILLCLYGDMNAGEIMLGLVVYVTPRWLSPILMGMSFAARDTADHS